MSDCVLQLDHETPRKLRWKGDVQGVAFELYVPKEVVPQPTPQWIRVNVVQDPASLGRGFQRRNENGIWALVERVADEQHTDTVRYCPVGESEDWIIGEPYIPKVLLTEPWPDQVGIVVTWN